jgi:hypothetical protein
MLIRPKFISGESWPGYLLRLANANEIAGIEGLSKLLDTTFIRLLTSSPQAVLEQLGILTDIRTDACDDHPIKKRSYLGVWGRTIRSRVCPNCLGSMQEPYIRASWDRAFQLTCLVHHVNLREECPSCRQEITYRRKKVERCDCGFHFSDGSNAPGVAVDMGEVLRVFGLEDIYSKEAPTFGASGYTEVCAVAVLQRMCLLEIGTISCKRPMASRGGAFVSTKSLRFLSAWFENWPDGFIRALSTTRAGITTAPTSLLLGTSQRTTGLFPVVRGALFDMDRRRRTSPKAGKQFPNSITLQDATDVGIKFLMNSAGCSYDVVKNWIAKGWLGQVKTFPLPGGQVGYRIDREMAMKAIHIAKSTSSPRELAAAVGIDARSIRVLAQSKVIGSIPYGRAFWNIRLHPSEVFQLAARLLDATRRGVASNDRRLLFQQAIALLQRDAPWLIQKFVQAVLAKQIAVRFMGKSTCRLDEITLLHGDLVLWREGFATTVATTGGLNDIEKASANSSTR